jgi:hypothetical protein
MVAVADRENHRIQIFALDGTLVSVIGEGDGVAAPAVPLDQRRGWPRTSSGRIVLRYPSSISARGRHLAVTCAGGVGVELDLAAAMLPAAAAAESVRMARPPANLRIVARGGVRCAS